MLAITGPPSAEAVPQKAPANNAPGPVSAQVAAHAAATVGPPAICVDGPRSGDVPEEGRALGPVPHHQVVAAGAVAPQADVAGQAS